MIDFPRTLARKPLSLRTFGASLSESKAKHMPFYRFHIDSDGSKHVVGERLKTIARKKPEFWESFRLAGKAPDRVDPPFIGIVQEDSFKLQRAIRYRNSFLPMVRGRIAPTPTGTRINVTMYIHPLVALFMMVFIFGTL